MRYTKTCTAFLELLFPPCSSVSPPVTIAALPNAFNWNYSAFALQMRSRQRQCAGTEGVERGSGALQPNLLLWCHLRGSSLPLLCLRDLQQSENSNQRWNSRGRMFSAMVLLIYPGSGFGLRALPHFCTD